MHQRQPVPRMRVPRYTPHTKPPQHHSVPGQRGERDEHQHGGLTPDGPGFFKKERKKRWFERYAREMGTSAAQPPPGASATSTDPPRAQAGGSRGTNTNVEVKHQMKQNCLKENKKRWLEGFVREPGSRLSIPPPPLGYRCSTRARRGSRGMGTNTRVKHQTD